MRRYETTFIVNPQADDAAIDQQVNAVIDLIKGDGGQILRDDRIGTRRLAYPIEGLIQGYYASLIYDAETTVLPKMDRFFKLEEPYVRSLTIRYEGEVRTAEEESEAAAAAAAKAVAPAPAESTEPPAVESTEPPAAEMKTEEPEKQAEVDAEPPASETAEPAADQPDTDDEEL